VPGGDADAIVREAQAFLGAVAVEDRKRGMFGYRASVDLGGYGIVAYGGEAQRGTVLVSINGEGCRRIANFGRVRSWAESLGARITRLDIAADDHESESLDIPGAIQAWRDGLFTLGGRPPKARWIDDFGGGEGCTLYVGTRQGGKLCRVYEKGKQLGDAESKWVRAEVELHAKDRVIPWDAVIDPVRYLAGSFPYFSFLSLVSERIRTIKRATEISIGAVARWVKLAAGKSLNVLLDHFDGDYVELVLAVKRDGIPKRLQGWWGAEERLAGGTG
jgi:phage replication initiation protein